MDAASPFLPVIPAALPCVEPPRVNSVRLVSPRLLCSGRAYGANRAGPWARKLLLPGAVFSVRVRCQLEANVGWHDLAWWIQEGLGRWATELALARDCSRRYLSREVKLGAQSWDLHRSSAPARMSQGQHKPNLVLRLCMHLGLYV